MKFYLQGELVILLNTEQGMHPLSPEWMIQGSGEKPRTSVSEEEVTAPPQRARWCILFWSLHQWLGSVPRRPHRWPRIGGCIKKNLGELKVLHLKKMYIYLGM